MVPRIIITLFLVQFFHSSLGNVLHCIYVGEVCPSAENPECFGPGTGPIHLDNVECNGSESSLLDCVFDDDSSDCSHREDAGVMCLLFA